MLLIRKCNNNMGLFQDHFPSQTPAVTTTTAWPTHSKLVIRALVSLTCQSTLEDLHQMGREIWYVDSLNVSESL
jgi:hypothetical protein